jgi:hypothetical protein
VYLRVVLQDKFARLAALRGDPVKGLPESAWIANLDDQDRDLLLRAAIHATRTLILPEWDGRRVGDRRPHAALEAAEAWLASKGADAIAAAKEAAKACTEARGETFGNDHRVPEAARACAWGVAAKDNTHIWEAFIAIEGELLARIQLVAEYHRQPEQRRNLLAAIRKVLEPVVDDTPKLPDGPVPYSARGVFVVGQHLTHPTFGALVVTAAAAATIDVQLPDGTSKRLAHRLGAK